jgi:hypothetical protein
MKKPREPARATRFFHGRCFQGSHFAFNAHLPPAWFARRPFQHIATAHRLDEPNAFLYLSVNPYHSAAAAGFLPSAY